MENNCKGHFVVLVRKENQAEPKSETPNQKKEVFTWWNLLLMFQLQ